MRIRSWAGGMAAAASLLFAQPAAAWPNAMSAQPIDQAPRICAPNIVALNHRCRVLDFAPLGRTGDGREWYYAFFSTHWADRHGKMDRGFPIIFYREGPATLRLGFWVNDEPGLAGRWALTPPMRPVLIRRPEGAYLGFTLRTSPSAVDQRLFRQTKKHWKPEIDVLHRTDAAQARLDAATPRSCEAADDGYYDWSRFLLIQALRHTLSHADCGYLSAELGVSGKVLTVTQVTWRKLAAKPAGAKTPPPSSPIARSEASSVP